MRRTYHLRYSDEAIDLITSRMPDDFHKSFVRLCFGQHYTNDQLALHFNYSLRQIQRFKKKIQGTIDAMDDIVEGKVVGVKNTDKFKVKQTISSEEYEPFTLKPCPICGKSFVPAPYHYWKIGTGNSFEDSRFDARTIRVCSYSCMRKWEKENGM